MTTIDELERVVNDYEQRINELKRLESVFNSLDTKGFEEESLSIKRKLKNPKALNQVKKELDDLTKKVQNGHKQTSVKASSRELAGIKERIGSLKSKNNDILLEDIEKKLLTGDVNSAENLLTERERSFNSFLELSNELDVVKLKIRKLTDRLADGELDSESYKRASDDFEKQEKEIEEKLWKLRNKLFKDEYEKPF